MTLEYSGEARRLVCQALGSAFAGLDKAAVATEPPKTEFHPRAGPGAFNLSSRERRRQVADPTISSKLAKKLLHSAKPRNGDDETIAPSQPSGPSPVPFWKKRRVEPKRVDEEEEEEGVDKFRALEQATAKSKALATNLSPPAKARRKG
eukprot:GGOE01060914.1.p2 GENE.GGOE01060914.1~~GGOE01060914.1.p2  ORF type:complete len:149 (+),score=40.58 GGOE01060914.1:63-509(+)